MLGGEPATDGPFLDTPDVLIGEPTTGAVMDDLTSQERQLIVTLRRLSSFTVIVHRNERWRIILADENAGRTATGEGEDFANAWDRLGSDR